ncbi:MAG: hypothetical protein R3F38_04825 [Gammaproteobacteria bacterium]
MLVRSFSAKSLAVKRAKTRGKKTL